MLTNKFSSKTQSIVTVLSFLVTTGILGVSTIAPVTTPPVHAANGLDFTSIPKNSSIANVFPGSGTVIKPCYRTFNCVMFRERVNIFQGLGKSRSAIDYCRAKYGNEATVEWYLGLRWCATPFQM